MNNYLNSTPYFVYKDCIKVSSRPGDIIVLSLNKYGEIIISVKLEGNFCHQIQLFHFINDKIETWRGWLIMQSHVASKYLGQELNSDLSDSKSDTLSIISPCLLMKLLAPEDRYCLHRSPLPDIVPSCKHMSQGLHPSNRIWAKIYFLAVRLVFGFSALCPLAPKDWWLIPTGLCSSGYDARRCLGLLGLGPNPQSQGPDQRLALLSLTNLCSGVGSGQRGSSAICRKMAPSTSFSILPYIMFGHNN